MFELTMYPALEGDCLVLSWGEEGAIHNMVIDGGRATAWQSLQSRLNRMSAAGETLDRLVLTHIDADHVEGLLKLTGDDALPIEPQQVWFNGFEQMKGLIPMGERQGDDFSDEIARLGWPLNDDFQGGMALVETAPPFFEIAGLKITMLSPDRPHLAAMGARWSQWRHGKGMVSMGSRPIPRVIDVDALSADSPGDREPPNGSSIAFVAEYEGTRVLLTGDAHPDMLEASLAPLAAAEGGRYRVDLLKVSHHGSRKNTSSALLRLLDCKSFAFSTDGSRHGHPDVEAVARVLRYSPPGRRRLYFNYRSSRNAPWNDASLMERHDYQCRWPVDDRPGELSIDLHEAATSPT